MKKPTVFAVAALFSWLSSAAFAATTITGLNPVGAATTTPTGKTLNYAIALDHGTSATSALPALAYITNKVTITDSGVYLSSLSPLGQTFTADSPSATAGRYLKYHLDMNRTTWTVEANAWAGIKSSAANINLLNSPTFLWSGTYGNYSTDGTSTLNDFALLSFGGASHVLNLYKKPLNPTEAANASANMVGLSLDPTARKLNIKGAFEDGNPPPDVIVLDGLNASIKINGNKVLTDSGVSANVGIGTNTPTARLTIKGTGITNASSFNIFNSADSLNFTVLDNGNVGIGDSNPTRKLEVAGNVKITGNPALNNGNSLVVVGKTVAKGEVTLEADVKVKNNAVIRVSQAGDLSMGGFTSGLNPLSN